MNSERPASPGPPAASSALRARGFQSLLDRRHEHWLLASMLLVLHAAIDAGFESALSRALMVTHLGLFFLWQPIWQKDERLHLPMVLFIGLFVTAVFAALNWWMIFGWLIVLVGLVAGRSFTTREERYVYMFSLAFLVSELLINCAATLFLRNPLPNAITEPFRIGLYVLPLLLYAIPPITVPQREPFPVDFFRGITFALMTALLAVFSALITFRMSIHYPIALVGTLMALGGLLLFLGWLTQPGTGGIGLLAVWEKSVLNIGTPFESWLGNVAEIAARADNADDFLEAAIEELHDIPWISGVEWQTGGASGMSGRTTAHHARVETGELQVTLYTERSFSSALLIHCRLLIQVLGHFHVAKRREDQEASEAHLRAIYETGARLTHDIKNLLQSLNTMTGALNDARSPEQEQRGVSLLKRRLPDVAERLQRALDKLERPQDSVSDRTTVADWWTHYRARLDDEALTADVAIERGELAIPCDTFDSVLDNLLDNAAYKRARGEAHAVRLTLRSDDSGVRCTVSDDGGAIEQAVAARLFREPVESESGHGIGLFQAARQAEASGCKLELTDNRDGTVAFTIACQTALKADARR